jgi:transitional endoplasmic reticulum ATPase
MSEAGTSGEVRARVEGARKRDAGRGIARLPESLQSELGLLSGDPVVIEGDRETVAKVWPGSDDGVVRIDADTRKSAGATVGDTVRLRGASVEEAAAVTLQPTDEGGAGDGSGPGADGRRDLPSDGTAGRRLRDRIVAPGKRLRVDGESFVVGETAPSGTVRVTDATAVTVDPEPATVDGTDETIDEEPTGTTYEDIGGLDEELDLVRETVELPLSEPETFADLGVDPPKGVLLYGPPGTGKTLIARAVANEVDAYFDTISGPEVVSKYKGESEQRLRRAFEAAAENAPAVLFIDEIDSIAGARDEDADMENRVVAQLLTLMDGLDTDEGVVVVGATNRVDDVDPALRRGGRFDREIEVGVPDEAGRREILTVHTREMPLAADVDLDEVAARTHGFVGADLASLAREAAMSALRRGGDGEGEREGAPEVTAADFERALAAVDPSAMREYVAESPDETFADVGGLGDTKDRLREAVEWPLSYGPLFEAAGADPPSGVLLYGPPGTGKTLLARAVAGESGVNFLRVAGPELLDRYVGESEEAVREVFERARQTAPAVVFLDEVDAVAGRRGETGEVTDRVVSQLLTELDRAADHPSLLVLAATNRKDSLDPALLRPGRLERHVEVPLPDEAARREILAVHARETPLAADVDLDAVAAETAGFSGAQLEALVRDASLRAVREVVETVEPEEAGEHTDRVTVTREHVDAALAALRASANPE